ncbi:MAG: D-2-hydroxyacid dehydrogenase [Vicinamibacterales bacterium]
MKILVAIFSETEAWTIPRVRVEDLRREFPELGFLHAESEEAMVRLIPPAEVAFTSRLTERAFRAAPALRWVHSPAAGVGSMLFPAMQASPVVLSNSRGMNAAAVAEHALLLMLALARRLPKAVRAQEERRWISNELSGLPSLRGRTLLIAGLGAIGRELAGVAARLGMHVIGTRRETGDPVPEGVSEAHAPSALRALLPRADVVVLAAPLTAETRGMMGAAELALMKPSAWLVNVARGKLVDEQALVRALERQAIAGAALDVFEHEPLAEGSPLWSMPGVLVTPHVAGFREDYWEAATALFAASLRRYLAGEDVANIVDKRAGY